MPPSFAPIITPALLSTIRQTPHLPPNTWYFITATTLAVLSRPDEIKHVYRAALGQNAQGKFDGHVLPHSAQLEITRRIREALVKAGAIAGMPKVINALNDLKEVTPEELLDAPEQEAPLALTGRREEIYAAPPAQILERGQAFFDQVYGKISRRVMSKLNNCGTEDLGLFARLLYSYVLSNTSVLSAVDTSYVMIAGLIPLDVSLASKTTLDFF
jgi:phage FluMu protein gp41